MGAAVTRHATPLVAVAVMVCHGDVMVTCTPLPLSLSLSDTHTHRVDFLLEGSSNTAFDKLFC